MDQSASAIYQDFLDRTGKALLAGDADAFLAHIHLPHTLVTETSTVMLADADTLRTHFHGFSNALKSQGVDEYTRVVTGAEFADHDTLHGQHTAYITSRGKLVVPVFKNEVTLVRRDGVWGAERIRHFAKYVAWPDLLPRVQS